MRSSYSVGQYDTNRVTVSPIMDVSSSPAQQIEPIMKARGISVVPADSGY
jgi:hypothetical protein